MKYLDADAVGAEMNRYLRLNLSPPKKIPKLRFYYKWECGFPNVIYTNFVRNYSSQKALQNVYLFENELFTFPKTLKL